MLAVVALVMAATAAQPPLTFRAEVVLARREVRLGDVADLGALPPGLKAGAAKIEIARLRPGQTRLELNSAGVLARARAMMPALTPWTVASTATRISVRLKSPLAPVSVGAPSCLQALEPVAAGSVPSRNQFSPAPCGEADLTAAFVWDRQRRVIRAARDLQPGDLVRAPKGLPHIRPGEAFTLKARVGPVVVERQVTAVQAAQGGGPVFVRGRDGEVFAARAPETDQ